MGSALAVWLAVHEPAAALFLTVTGIVLAPFTVADLIIRALMRLEDHRWLKAWDTAYNTHPPAHDHWSCRSRLQCRRTAP